MSESCSVAGVLCSVPHVSQFIAKSPELRLVSKSFRDAYDANCTCLSVRCHALKRMTADRAPIIAATTAFRKMVGRGFRPTTLRVMLCDHTSIELLLDILLTPLTVSILHLHLQGAASWLPSVAGARQLAAALPAITALQLEVWPPLWHQNAAEGTRDGDGTNSDAATTALLHALGPRLRTLSLEVDVQTNLHLDPHLQRPLRSVPGSGQFQGPQLAGLLPRDLAACCPALTELRVALRPRKVHCELPPNQRQQLEKLQQNQRQQNQQQQNQQQQNQQQQNQQQQNQQQQNQQQQNQPLFVAPAAAVQVLGGVARLTCLMSLELHLPYPVLHAGDWGAQLPTLAVLAGLTRLVLPLCAAEPDGDGAHPAPKSSHLVYGAAVRNLLFHLHCRTPPAPALAHLVELDLGLDLALTLPYLPYNAPALTRLCVGELSAEAVPPNQWDVVPGPPPSLPLELLSDVPGEFWDRMGNRGGGDRGSDGGDREGDGGRPRCSLPLAAVRLPPQLRLLQVRYMPDVAVLAALAALPDFYFLDCTAVRHPQGEICLDLASVGLPGPPDLGGGGGGGSGTAAVAPWVSAMVAAAAGLLLRVLRDADWLRHPLTLRPSPFSFLRDGYSRLRWTGPHAAWMAAVASLATQVTRVRVKQMALQRADVAALAEALPGLRSLELVRCSARRSDIRAWRASLAAVQAVLDAAGADAPPGGPADYDDMFCSSSSSSSSSCDEA